MAMEILGHVGKQRTITRQIKKRCREESLPQELEVT
jgi:hypothetical protein